MMGVEWQTAPLFCNQAYVWRASAYGYFHGTDRPALHLFCSGSTRCGIGFAQTDYQTWIRPYAERPPQASFGGGGKGEPDKSGVKLKTSAIEGDREKYAKDRSPLAIRPEPSTVSRISSAIFSNRHSTTTADVFPNVSICTDPACLNSPAC